MLKWLKFVVVTLMTVSRILLAAVVFQLLSAGVFEYALGVFIFAATLDFDGSYARMWKVTTKFGAFLDPVADKVLMLTAIYGLYVSNVLWSRQEPLWTIMLILPSIIIAFREFGTLIVPTIELFRRFYNGRNVALQELFILGDADAHTRPPSTQMGKWKMGVQCVAVSILMSGACTVDFEEQWIAMTGNLLWFLGGALYWLAGYFTFITGLDYLRKVVPIWEPRITNVLERCWMPASLA
jgi:phosphatidylglycerophosphate synthase